MAGAGRQADAACGARPRRLEAIPLWGVSKIESASSRVTLRCFAAIVFPGPVRVRKRGMAWHIGWRAVLKKSSDTVAGQGETCAGGALVLEVDRFELRG